MPKPLLEHSNKKVSLSSPSAMPLASSFLWNSHMMIQANCRGYATAQFMQPEPSKYAHAPNLEAKTFMQPEQAYYAHHPGRFVYVKDLQKNTLFSAPFEPVRGQLDEFSFTAGQDSISWRSVKDQIALEMTLSLHPDKPLELWQIKVSNLSSDRKHLSITPYFPVGYMSWMNQSAAYNTDLNAVICRSVTPYQKHTDYFKQRDFKDLTYLLAERTPDSWEARQSSFEGDGGLHNPSALEKERLANSDALYETPTAAIQYKVTLDAGESESYRLAFGPAHNEKEIAEIANELFDNNGFHNAQQCYSGYVAQGRGPIKIKTPDAAFDDYVNNWLPRQVFYHGDVNRLSTDPQTRNYLQDNMGMSYIKPSIAREAFLRALTQQNINGAMPDGILLSDQAELKYINQIPHTDHCVWLPVCLGPYLDETGDYELLDEQIAYADSDQQESVRQHINRAMQWLYRQQDHRGLNYIQQGDWCDPMNMVGYKGKGVSSWLTLATAYANKLWGDILKSQQQANLASEFYGYAEQCNQAVNQHFWHEQWYGRGITDDDTLFGIASDSEGSIFLNPQSWAMLSGAADDLKTASIVESISKHLETPFGVEMLAPSFTAMRDDIGRVTQKHPGSAENGSIYNHASAFYVYALYNYRGCDSNGETASYRDKAYGFLRQMIPGSDASDQLRRGQMPTFIPNYYRGAYRQFERTAGRSSQLFNTGTVHWFYRCLIDGLFGVQGCAEGLRIAPQLPSDWPGASLSREFRGAHFQITIERAKKPDQKMQISVNGKAVTGSIIPNPEFGQQYQVVVKLASQ